ncbi:MAG: T9SS type A sorting domain-containing protein [Cyclobacteriaceae bacterium]|nr:T9SS type A sorting domain-containing protein [Cyclobacteriaceae bacterium]
MKKHSLLLVLLLSSLLLHSQSFRHDITVLDLTTRNAEPTSNNLFSLEHILKSAGFSYSVTTSVNEAIASKVILTASPIEPTTLNQPERDSLKAFVERGGIAIVHYLKDAKLFSTFGVSSTKYLANKYSLTFDTGAFPGIFSLLDDDREKTIMLADSTKYTYSIDSRYYVPTSADVMARYETNEAAICHAHTGNGHAYVIGFNYEDLILRPQVKRDLSASRGYSNTFEPAQDVFIFTIAGIIRKHLPYAINKHTVPWHYKGALVITHDVDATTSIGMFDDYAGYERSNQISATYLITTHYMHDKIAKNFFDDNMEDLRKIKEDGHDVQSHSVSHVPDFDNATVVPMGQPGNTRATYAPIYDGTVSSGVTVFGEAEVSRQMLEETITSKITCFRPGYLAFHYKLINVLDSLHYPFSSSHSANDVMTNFPFFSHTDLSMTGRLTRVLEIPNHISDVFMIDPIAEENYMQKLDTWKVNFTKAYNNELASVLLIHPNRYFKLYAQNLLVQYLPTDAVITNLSEYGNFWLNRDSLDFTSSLSGNQLTIQLSAAAADLNPQLSLVVANGKNAQHIRVVDKYGMDVQFLQKDWHANDVMLYHDHLRPNYTQFTLTEKPVNQAIYIYPHPSGDGNAKLHFEVMEETLATVEVFNGAGQKVCTPLFKTDVNAGINELNLFDCAVSAGHYVVRLSLGEEVHTLHWIAR